MKIVKTKLLKRLLILILKLPSNLSQFFYKIDIYNFKGKK